MTSTSALLPTGLERVSSNELHGLAAAIDGILEARNEAELPAKVVEAVQSALAEEEPDAPAPVSAEFETREYDDGFAWDNHDVVVTLADGSTRALDLTDHHSDLSGVLADHSVWSGPNECSTLRVTFEPLALELNS